MEDPKLFAPCGTYCGVCPWRLAYITKDDNLKSKLAKMIGMNPDDIICEGCRSDLPLYFCKSCGMKKCVNEKGFDSCADCDEFPCKIVEKFPFRDFITRVKWDVKYRKEHGKEDWFKKTIDMNTCPSCNQLAHWRASICKSCGTALEKRYND